MEICVRTILKEDKLNPRLCQRILIAGAKLAIQYLPDLCRQHACAEGFLDVVISAGIEHSLCGRIELVAAVNDGFDTGSGLFQQRVCLGAAHDGHRHIKQDQVNIALIAANQINRLLAVQCT